MYKGVDPKLVGQIAIFVAMMAALGMVVYETVLRQPVDIFFSSMLTLILGKYLQQVGFSQGSDSSGITAKTVADGVVQGLNGGPNAQLQATQEQTRAIRENTASTTGLPLIPTAVEDPKSHTISTPPARTNH